MCHQALSLCTAATEPVLLEPKGHNCGSSEPLLHNRSDPSEQPMYHQLEKTLLATETQDSQKQKLKIVCHIKW